MTEVTLTGNLALADLLLTHRLVANARDNDGQSALGVATCRDNDDMVRLLKSHGARNWKGRRVRS